MKQNEFTALIVGAGSAGHACASELLKLVPGAQIKVIDAEPGGAINRMLVTKGVLPGLLGAELIAQPPLTGVERISARAIALLERQQDSAASDFRQPGVRIDDGRVLFADAVVVATGSRASSLTDGIEVDPGVPLYTVQTAADAAELREAVAVHQAAAEARDDGGVARILVIGAGFIGTEVASYLNGIGVETVVIARTDTPLLGAFGRQIAAQLGELHADRAGILVGNVQAIRAAADGVLVELSGGELIAGDAVVVAIGASPASEWATAGSGIAVDDRLRMRGADVASATVGMFAAGGVAVHEINGERVSIDHWDAAAEQGRHAARVIASDFGFGEDPGSYLPTSGFTLQAYGHTFAGMGYRVAMATERSVTPQAAAAAMLTEMRDGRGVLTGVAGFDAGAALRERIGDLGR